MAARNRCITIDYFDKLCKVPMFIPNNLRSLLAQVKELGEMCTFDEVLDGMQSYIIKKRLFDIQDPRNINCANDPLKDVVGVPHFTLYEIRQLLFKAMLHRGVNKVEDLVRKVALYDESQKIKTEDDLGGENRHTCEQSSTSSFNQIVKEIKELLMVSDESEEDVLSNYTVIASGSLIATVNRVYDIEYEVQSDSSASHNVTDTDSEFENSVKDTVIQEVIKADSDIGFWADMSSEELCGESDEEISELDKWECVTCGSRNKPVMRYCLRCWEERAGWSDSKKERRQPPRPKNRCRKRKRWLSKEGKEVVSDGSSSLASASSSQAGASSSQAGVSSSQAVESSFEASSSQASCSSSQPSCSSQLTSSTEASQSNVDVCILCCQKPKNATVVHGNSGHQFCCYRCARKLLSLNKPCPICRKAIDRVIHQISI